MRAETAAAHRIAWLALLVVGCQSAPNTGAACVRAGECSAGLICSFGRCRAGCMENRDCPVGAACLPSSEGGACSLATDLGCESGVGRVCASGLVCVADRCEARCTTPSECPGDGACVTSASGVSFCGRGSGLDGGTATDAGEAADVGADAGALDASMPVCTQVCTTDQGQGCALVAGAVYCWGSDSGQRLGDGDMQRVLAGGCASCRGSATPVPVVRDGTTTPLTGMIDLACGGAHACAIDAAGAMFCWGDDSHAQLGTGSSGAPTGAVRAAVFATTPVDRMALGRSHTCVRVRSTHELRCVGENRSGQIDPTRPAVGPAVDPIAPIVGATTTPLGSTGVSLLAAGGVWTCATLEPNGALRCWGWNEQGQTGGATPGSTTSAIDRGTTTIATSVTSLATGYQTTCFVTAGAVRCIGSSIGGALGQAGGLSDCTPGDGDTNDCTVTPVDVQPGVRIETVFGGPGVNQFCGLGADGALCWGYNDRGQAGQPSSGPIVVALPPFLDARGSAGVCDFGLASTVGCAALDDGRVLCAGDDTEGQLGDGTADARADGVPSVVVLP